MAATEAEAIVLGRTDLGESDRIVRLLTEAQGRVDAVARGARRSRRRFGGALEPGTRGVARWQRGRGELPTLVSFDVLRAPHAVRDDYDRLVLLGYGCDLLAVLSERDLAADKGYGLLGAWLALLEGAGRPAAASRLALEAKALTFAGLTPALVRCATCGRPLDDPARWSAEAGGGVHEACGAGGNTVRASALAELEDLRRTPLARTVDRDAPEGARYLLMDFVEHHARRRLPSRALLDTLEDP